MLIPIFVARSAHFCSVCFTPSPVPPAIEETPNPTTLEPTPAPSTPAPSMCEEQRWYFQDEIDGCSNVGPAFDGDEGWELLEDCCMAELGLLVEDCPSFNKCVPTSSPTFGSTPTVSKETTAPPTGPNDRTD